MSTQQDSDKKLKIITAIGIVIAIFLFFVFIFGGPKAPENAEEEQGTVCAIENHEYVDLGLPSGLKWATCNIGASVIEDFGDYFQWGQTQPMPSDAISDQQPENILYEKDFEWLQANGYLDAKGNLKPEYDAAAKNWGGTWRMPTNDEIEELIQNCSIEWTALNGVSGYVVTSNNNGKSIFFPAGGYRNGASLEDKGNVGDIWTSTPNPEDLSCSYCLNYFEGIFYSNWSFRSFGYNIRPVSE